MRPTLFVCLACVLGSAGCGPTTVKPDPPLTVAELRKEVSPLMRMEPSTLAAADNGWSTVAALEMKLPKASWEHSKSGGAGTYDDEPWASQVEDTLSDWQRTPGPNLVSRTERLLSVAQPALADFRLASARKIWQPPALDANIIPSRPRDQAKDSSADVFTSVKKLGKAVLLRSELELSSHNPKAVDDLLLDYSAGHRLIAGHGTLFQFVVGLNVAVMASRQIQRDIGKHLMNRQELSALLSGLKRTSPDLRDDLANSVRYDFDLYLLRPLAGLPDPATRLKVPADLPGDADLIVRLLVGHPNPLNRRETIRLASQTQAKFIDAIYRTWSGNSPVDAELNGYFSGWPGAVAEGSLLTPQEEEAAGRDLRKIPNALGRLVIALEAPSLSQTDMGARKAEVDFECTEVEIGCELYRLDHRREPPTLQSLVDARYLDSVPADPFSDGPLRYDSVRKRVWSVGPDGVDNGGLDTPGANGMANDIVIPTDGVFPRLLPRVVNRPNSRLTPEAYKKMIDSLRLRGFGGAGMRPLPAPPKVFANPIR